MHIFTHHCVLRVQSNFTPIQLTCQGGHLAVARLLLDRGADVNCVQVHTLIYIYMPDVHYTHTHVNEQLGIVRIEQTSPYVLYTIAI